MWNRRATTWESHGSAGLGKVVLAVLEQAAAGPGKVVVDLGSGTGQLSLPLAATGALVTAVDISPVMISRLVEKAYVAGLSLHTVVGAVEQLSFPPASVDLVVTNYALHHLRDDEKRAAVYAAALWLRPGGRLVVGDMMFGRGSSARDRRIIVAKARSMLRRGPAGWYRLAKNLVRFTVRRQERPVPPEEWIRHFVDAGLVDVIATAVVAEAMVVCGVKA